jgi:sec-independent protein translocase protein TatB
VFGVGLPELAVILVVAVIVFGPDRLPDFARQAGRMLRQLRDFSNAARDDIRKELGPEFADFELTDLDPRRAVRKYMSDVMDDDPGETVPLKRGLRPLERGERPPYDADAT